MQDKTKNHPNTYLWQARKRSGLAQKNVSFLLNQKSTNNLSLYESGQRNPNLLIALKLEVIYRVPVRILFHNLYWRAIWQVRERGQKHDEDFADEKIDFSTLEKQLQHGDYCTYSDLLKIPNLPRIEREKIREHLIYLAHALDKTDGGGRLTRHGQ
jgi:DNA-binding XRE family transcriptional regulator